MREKMLAQGALATLFVGSMLIQGGAQVQRY